MKKTLIAVAALSTMAAGAMAADVTLSGRLDGSLTYHHVKKANTTKSNYFGLQSGQYTGSRWGIKGTEDFGNGWKVGFILESGFTSDDGNVAGKMAGTDKAYLNLFNREASVKVYSPAGTFSFGKVGSLKQGTSSVAWVGDYSAMSTGIASTAYGTTRISYGASVCDNNVAYESPWINGFQFGVTYAFGDDSADLANKSNREMSAGMRYANGGFKAAVIADYVRQGRENVAKGYKNPFSIFGGAQYNFGPAVGYLAVAYQKDGTTPSFSSVYMDKLAVQNNGGYKGFGTTVSVKVPVGAGDIRLSYLYNNHKCDVIDNKVTAHNVALGGSYRFSKTVEANAFVGYTQRKQTYVGNTERDFGVTAGLTKYF